MPAPAGKCALHMDTTTQIYLELTMVGGEVLGESNAGGYETRIDIDSFDFAAIGKAKSLKDATSSSVGSNPDFSPVTVTKVFDRASLLIANAMKNRQKFTEAKIAVDQQYIDPEWVGKERNEILILYLYDGYITEVTLRTSEGGTGAEIKETAKLSYQNYRVVYYAEKRDEVGKLLDDWRPQAFVYETSRTIQEA